MKINMLTLDDDTLEEIPLSSYPRPQLKRNSYFCLNGEWDFATSKQDKVTSYDQKIIVPFPMESSLSSINRIKEDNEKLFYKKIFRLPNGFIKDKVILHFGAVDQKCVVKLNNQVLGTHEGGYTPFEFEIKEKLDYINILEVIVEDSLDLDYPYGKQKTKRGGMWYTKISGIWQSVWIESVPEEYIKELKITPTIDTINIKVIGNTQKKEITIYTPEGEYKETFFSDEFSYKFTSPRNWSPEDPYLYHFTIKTTSDEVKSYFALRELTIEEDNGRKYLFLNREKYFFHGLLDQGADYGMGEGGTGYKTNCDAINTLFATKTIAEAANVTEIEGVTIVGNDLIASGKEAIAYSVKDVITSKPQDGKAAVDGIYWCLYFQCERLANEKSIISCRAGRYRKVTA